MKRKIIVLSLIFVLIASMVALAETQTVLYEKITIGTGAAVALTTPPEGCNLALIICETNDIRYRMDGTDPTSTTGMPLSSGQNILMEGYKDIKAFKAIAVSSTAYLSVQYAVKY